MDRAPGPAEAVSAAVGRRRSPSPSRSRGWGSPNRSPSPNQTRSRRRSRSVSVSRGRDLSRVQTLSSRHRKTTATRRSPTAADRSQGGVTNGEVYDKFSHGSHLRSGEGGRTPRQKKSRTRRSLSLSPPLTDDGAAADASLHGMSEAHTMSSRHRKTVANTRGSPQKGDLTFGGVTAAELFDKFQSGMHLRDGRPVAEATSTGHARRASSPPEPTAAQQRLASRLATPTKGRTVFQQREQEEKARHEQEQAEAQAAARRLRKGAARSGGPGYLKPRGNGRVSRACTPPPPPRFTPQLSGSFLETEKASWGFLE